MHKDKKKVLVAMSGGVDSSVAACLLKEQGYDVVGVTMCLGIPDNSSDLQSTCCGKEAIDDAKKVCVHLGIAHYVLDFSREMQQLVINDFIREYQKGHTPNPCINCNKHLKFGKLLAYAKNMGFDLLATGHYAGIKKHEGENRLFKAKDNKKDQTYFLYCIKKEDLAKIVFPLANYTKEEVRIIAKQKGIPVFSKAESQDICFVPGGDYKKFLSLKIGKQESGEIINKNGEVLGKHQGIVNYTIGQRSGLGISAVKPMYVIALDKKNNRVIAGEKKDLQKNKLTAINVNRLIDVFPEATYSKIRYGNKEVLCRIVFNEQDKVEVVFKQPQEAVTPGQSIVFYHNDIVLGGGIIREALVN